MRIILFIAAALFALPLLAFAGVYFLSEAKLRAYARVDAPDLRIPTDAAAIERGRVMARTRGCFGCHGQQLEGRDFSEQWPWIAAAVAPNLAAYARRHDAATLDAAIRRGIGADGRALWSMPSYNFARLSDDDTAALIAFLRAAPVVETKLPNPRLGWAVRWAIARGAETHMAEWARRTPPLRIDPDTDPSRARGEYLAMTTCNECHGLDLRGQALFEGDYTPDLAIVASYSRDDFDTLVRTGVPVGGRDIALMALVAPDRYAGLGENEVDDLYAYLQSLAAEPLPENVFWRQESR